MRSTHVHTHVCKYVHAHIATDRQSDSAKGGRIDERKHRRTIRQTDKQAGRTASKE